MKQAVVTLPETGLGSAELISVMQDIKSVDSDWNSGKIFGYVFYPGDDEARIIESAHRLFSSENALNPSLFSSLKRFENETVKMVSGLLPEEIFRKISSSASGIMGGKGDKPSMGAAMYGITSGLENRGNVHDMVLDVLDGMY